MPVSSWLPYVQVKSADDVAVATGKHGGRVLTGPMEVPGGDRITTGLDPQGAAFAVHWKAVVVPAPPTAKAKPKVKAKAKAKTKAKPRARAKARPKAKARKTRR
jgi:hypothetical protein